MADLAFQSIEQAHLSGGPAAALDELVRTLESRKDYHRLFDALLLKKKFEMGLPLARPASFDLVPEQREAEFEETYVQAARRVGEAFLKANDIPQAWIYLRTIREPEPVTQALEALPSTSDPPENVDELIAIALYERANPVQGLKLMLSARGTCNTISAFDQAAPQISAQDRIRGAELLVRHLYGEVLQSVCRDVERRSGDAFSAATLREAIAGRDWLFDDGNYHVDVSHLAAVVRFARFLTPESPSVDMTLQLCEYGVRLAPQFQYPADPPFDEYYTAHLYFFRMLAGVERDQAMAYFRGRLATAAEMDDRRMIAYLLVDLLVRIGAQGEAVAVADEFLSDLDESSGFSFAQLCEQAKRMDVYREAGRRKGDLVGFTAALVAIDKSAGSGTVR
jgi:hypothetical protein